MKVLVTGIKGQLGHDVIKELQKRKIEHIGVDIDDFDITDEEKTSLFLERYNPDAVIHCSAYTAVEKAEDNVELCSAVNIEGTRNIAKVCSVLDSKMIYVSTDYVFPGVGDGFYEVYDEPGPLGVYGQTKLEGELAVKLFLDKYFIVRTSWVFGLNGNNFIKTMLRLSETQDNINVVSDQIGSPTYTVDLASLLCDMVVTDKYGTYHATNEGVCSWSELAKEIFRVKGLNTKVHPITTEEYASKVKRPKNSRLSKKSLDNAGFKRLPDWRDALKRYLIELNCFLEM